MPSAGNARTSRKAVASTAEIAGRRSTMSGTRFQKRLSPPVRRSRPTNGMRPFSTRSPSTDSTAGTTVTEPIMATSTTVIAPTPSAVERLIAGQEHPGHGGHHGHAGDQDRAAGGG